MKNIPGKQPFSCSIWFQEQFLLVKNKITRILKKISPKTLWIQDPEKFHPGSRG
jgi:hypothetical protein